MSPHAKRFVERVLAAMQEADDACDAFESDADYIEAMREISRVAAERAQNCEGS